MKLRILLAEDDGIQALALESELREAGHEVVAITKTLSDTIQFLAEHRVDVVVLDLELRGSLAFPVLDAARRVGVQQIVVTGLHLGQTLQKLREVQVINKPFDTNELLVALSRLSRSARDDG